VVSLSIGSSAGRGAACREGREHDHGNDAVSEQTVTVDQLTLTRSDIAAVIQQKCGMNRAEARYLIASLIEQMREAIAADGKLKVRNFGTFAVIEKNARIGRNPRNGETHPISSRRIVAFRASPILKGRTSRSYSQRLSYFATGPEPVDR
jgi:integration host factor subunit alpha